MSVSAPRWDLSNVYPSLDSKEFKSAVEDYKKQVAALEKFFKKKLSKAEREARRTRRDAQELISPDARSQIAARPDRGGALCEINMHHRRASGATVNQCDQ